jgi:GT2 family glycosyltransferase
MTNGPGLPPLTIIVPVYGALPQTLACLDAIAQTKDEITGVRVLVIDDATPDDEVVRALTNVCARHGFDLLRNRENLGFVETCNRGFDEVTTGHVLILNSDTVPFPGWLEAMLDAAHEGVASVTAVSNNASIYSLPRHGTNPFSVDFTPADLAGIVRSTGSEDPIVIPTGVGFCMLMTRPALDSIGGFDPSFGRGYGEENDWCMRAIHAGYRHLLAPGAFVYHEGNASMAEAGVIAKGETTHPENQRLLVSRYPEYPGLVDKFLEQSDLRVIRDRVTDDSLKHLRSRRPTILHWLHADPYGAHAAGTEVTVRGLVGALGREVVSLIIHPTGRGTLEVSWRANDLVSSRSLIVSG